MSDFETNAAIAVREAAAALDAGRLATVDRVGQSPGPRTLTEEVAVLLERLDDLLGACAGNDPHQPSASLRAIRPHLTQAVSAARGAPEPGTESVDDHTT
ncbi:hypothetical protein [Actinomycetospora lemnae]|uniref:Uncharacterized protein n=1 Tax=Actinomycetospora lemnae TaxID=3019891 RepID=A0ABT5SSZ7_9PSEU|nr:hypothetical protein [Actinomycetospora sp. DW7H6]MDD7965899.1 hypothetical protein [Actinomycetospora sp. DW7H6]